ncbi:MAG: hypothetical protein JHD18_06230 [Rhodoferax sp.]|nr:hypothetical protein [Rhodoferax sp.]MBJ7468328.1 hypothetical protein [Rhodoferax sp.]
MAGFFVTENNDRAAFLDAAPNGQKKEQQAHGSKPYCEYCDNDFEHDVSPLAPNSPKPILSGVDAL